MDTNTQPRQPSGTPVGGQFAGKSNPESDTMLEVPGPLPVIAPVSATRSADLERVRRIAMERTQLETDEMRLARSLIAADVVSKYPSATQYVIQSEPDDMGGWYP